MKSAYRILVVAILVCVMSAGCGRNIDGQSESTQSGVNVDVEKSENETIGQQTVIVEKRELPMPTEEDGDWTRFSMQFWNNEVIQIWGRTHENENGEKIRNVYAYREDDTGEILLENVEKEYYSRCFLCADEKLMLLSGSGLIGLDENRKEYFRWTGGNVTDICQLTDGRVIMLVRENTDKKQLKMAELFLDTGSVNIIKNINLDSDTMQYIGTCEQGVMIMNQSGLWEVNLEDGSMECTLSLKDAAYQMVGVNDFRIKGNDTVEVLQNGKIETLQLTKGLTEKKVIVYQRTGKFDSIERLVNLFNETSENYYVVLKMLGEDEELSDYRNRISAEIVAGGGADIYDTAVFEDVGSMIQKGVLVDLSPYMEVAGIYEEDYFPATFRYRDGVHIYSVCPSIYIGFLKLNDDILDNKDITSMAELLDVLLDYQEKTVFREYWDSGELVEYFLAGSDNLWGRIDWENGNCDFSGELFEKILKVAKQYGWKEGNTYPSLAVSLTVKDMYEWRSDVELEGEGKVRLGYWFDEGAQARLYESQCLVLNQNSANLEGAWEFINFLICEETQREYGKGYTSWENGVLDRFVVNKNAYDYIAQKELEEGAIAQEYDMRLGIMLEVQKAGQDKMVELGWDREKYCELYNLAETDIVDIREAIENANWYPGEHEEIIAIINEEAGAYFSGMKSIEEVVRVIENRVQLYLDEQN